eukprot:COSAG02_NODE_12_length_58022_cov_242.077379_36_plen_76_part_00
MALASQRLPETVSMKRLLFVGQVFNPDDTLASKGVTKLSCLEVAWSTHRLVGLDIAAKFVLNLRSGPARSWCIRA